MVVTRLGADYVAPSKKLFLKKALIKNVCGQFFSDSTYFSDAKTTFEMFGRICLGVNSQTHTVCNIVGKFMFSFNPTGNIRALVVVTMLGRFFITFSINTVTQLTHEIMPTQLRAQGTALANSLGGLCMIASPYVAYSVRYILI
jgi:hypothetical protein